VLALPMKAGAGLSSIVIFIGGCRQPPP